MNRLDHRTITLILATALGAGLVACQDDEVVREPEVYNPMQDARGIDATQPASEVIAAQADDATAASGVLQDMAHLHRAELAFSGIAQKSASDAEVRSYAELLADDHTRGLQQVQQTAQQLGVEVEGTEVEGMEAEGMEAGGAPPQLATVGDGQTEQKLEQLRGLQGAEFDQAFVRLMIEEHDKGIAKLREARGQVQEPELTRLIDQQLPVLQKHLDRAQALGARLGATATR